MARNRPPLPPPPLPHATTTTTTLPPLPPPLPPVSTFPYIVQNLIFSLLNINAFISSSSIVSFLSYCPRSLFHSRDAHPSLCYPQSFSFSLCSLPSSLPSHRSIFSPLSVFLFLPVLSFLLASLHSPVRYPLHRVSNACRDPPPTNAPQFIKGICMSTCTLFNAATLNGYLIM